MQAAQILDGIAAEHRYLHHEGAAVPRDSDQNSLEQCLVWQRSDAP